jgi:Spy/CpxP family protein refolding chaperone
VPSAGRREDPIVFTLIVVAALMLAVAALACAALSARADRRRPGWRLTETGKDPAQRYYRGADGGGRQGRASQRLFYILPNRNES